MQAPSIEESLKAPSFVTRLAFTLTNVCPMWRVRVVGE